jgi:hypothetical protein
MTDTHENVFIQSKLARMLHIDNVETAKQRVRQGLYGGLGAIGIGLGIAIFEPGSLADPAITVESASTDQNTVFASEADRLGATIGLPGMTLALTAVGGLLEIRRAETIDERNNEQ